MGVCMWKISDRPDLVLLSFLGTRFSPTPARLALGANWPSGGGDLSHLGCRQRSWRMVVLIYDPAGSFCERGTKNRHAWVCDRHRSHRVRSSRECILASR